jgi:hypothetical protein
MKESYGKDLASHPDPESCVGGRKDAGEALTGAHVGQPSSCEIRASGVPTPLSEAEGNTEDGVIGEPSEDPAQSETLRTRGNPLHGKREIPQVPIERWLDGSAGKGHWPYLRRARLGEVGRPCSTWEAAEQRRARVARGGGGGKAVDQGEHKVGGRVPDSEPERRAVLAPLCAASRVHRASATTRGKSRVR